MKCDADSMQTREILQESPRESDQPPEHHLHDLGLRRAGGVLRHSPVLHFQTLTLPAGMECGPRDEEGRGAEAMAADHSGELVCCLPACLPTCLPACLPACLPLPLMGRLNSNRNSPKTLQPSPHNVLMWNREEYIGEGDTKKRLRCV